MNYTKNYRLPQWVKEDRIMMDDFNAMNTSIESGLTRTDAKADSANTKADTAVQIANAAANAKPYAVGHHTATGEDQEISVGFRPSFLIISGMGDTTIVNSDLSWTPYFALTGGHVLTNRVGFTDTGFTVYDRNHGGGLYPDFTDKGRGYDYIAFK